MLFSHNPSKSFGYLQEYVLNVLQGYYSPSLLKYVFFLSEIITVQLYFVAVWYNWYKSAQVYNPDLFSRFLPDLSLAVVIY